MMTKRNVEGVLADWQERIRGWALEYGLDFYETIFEVVDYDEMNMLAAYGGFPTRYPHWRWGMEYERMSRGYQWGLQKIYEMVINNDPSYAYLLDCNPVVDQKLVMAHVYGHVDFFKNNYFFSHTNRKMMDQMANHAVRVRRIADRVGVEAVEEFLDMALSLDNLIDSHGPYFRRPGSRGGNGGEEPHTPRKLRNEKTYLDKYINPPEFLDAQTERETRRRQRAETFPANPQKDVLQFLIEHAPLKPWQAEILGIVRDEAYYLLPQGQTKIMNEGWASYWHTTIMTQKALEPSEVIDYAEHHSGTVAMNGRQLNPYKLGLELLRDIERRWDTGRFGPEYEECTDRKVRANWDRQLGLGREKIFEVRRVHNDITFIDTFLTEEFCERHNLFVYNYDERGQVYRVSSREFGQIKQKLLFMLTNFGQPHVYLVDANHGNRGELLLEHAHEGVDLRLDWARKTLANLEQIWRRPVNIVSRFQERPVAIRCADSEIDQRFLD